MPLHAASCSISSCLFCDSCGSGGGASDLSVVPRNAASHAPLRGSRRYGRVLPVSDRFEEQQAVRAAILQVILRPRLHHLLLAEKDDLMIGTHLVENLENRPGALGI
jgi:hypothetical protein